MKFAMILALGLVSSAAFASHRHGSRVPTGASSGGITCHQGYEYKMVRVFGKVAFATTGRRCVFGQY